MRARHAVVCGRAHLPSSGDTVAVTGARLASSQPSGMSLTDTFVMNVDAPGCSSTCVGSEITRTVRQCKWVWVSERVSELVSV